MSSFRVPLGGAFLFITKKGNMITISRSDQQALIPQWEAALRGSYEVMESGCWHWKGRVDRYGYGVIRALLNGRIRSTGAHRASWVVTNGTIPDGLTIDHLCLNKVCVNPHPEHTEAVTNLENIRRRVGTSTGRPKIPTHQRVGCGRHGKADGRFVNRKDGYTAWDCRICGRERVARFYERQR